LLPRMGRALLIPVILTAVALLLTALAGMGGGALFAYGLVYFSGFVALTEIHRGVLARLKSGQQALTFAHYIGALWGLFGRNRRRYGGYVVHLGIAIIGIGVIGSTVFQQQTQRTIGIGQSLALGGYQLRYDGFEEGIAEDGRRIDIANVTLIRNGQELVQMRPRLDRYPNMTMTIAAAHSTLENDFYVLLAGWEPTTHAEATFKVYINPLVNLIWWGGLVLIAGTLIGTWSNAPQRANARQTHPIGLASAPTGD
jgi:cytochrome c-type biogenesis protein CcmF